MRSMMLETVSLSVQVETLRVIAPAHRLVERRGAAFGERTHNVAFGEDADNAAVGAEDEQPHRYAFRRAAQRRTQVWHWVRW